MRPLAALFNGMAAGCTFTSLVELSFGGRELWHAGTITLGLAFACFQVAALIRWFDSL